jgi:hypothetical protein
MVLDHEPDYSARWVPVALLEGKIGFTSQTLNE